jgi:hypothetical protein
VELSSRTRAVLAWALWLAAGLAWAYTIPVQPWIDQLVREHRPLPLVPQLVAATGDLSWAPAIAFGVTLPALLLPNGHLRSRRWRPVVITSVTGLVLVMVAGPLSPGPLEEMGVDNPLGLAGPAGNVAAVLTIVGVVLHWLSLPPAAVCVVLQFRSSRGVERQQMRWVAAGAAAAVIGLAVSLPSGLGLAPDWISAIIFPALLCPPVAVAVAALRYRLYDLDLIISRTLTWALLTVLLGLGYAAVVLGLSRLAARAPAWSWPPPPWAWWPPSRPCAAGSRTWSTAASTAAATTPPAPSRRSRPGSATRSTWTRCTASCWPWSTRPCSRPGPRCGCATPPRDGVPAVAAIGYARARRRPAPDLLSGAHATGSRR